MESKEKLIKEVKTAAVEEWVKKFSETGEINFIEKSLLREVLEYSGADFYDHGSKERLNELASLSEYSNKGKGDGMRAVWGEEMVGKEGKFNDWTNSWARDYMERTGKKLPKITQTDKKTKKQTKYYNSGMMAFFGEITSYAAGRMEFSLLKIRLEARYKNGTIFQAEERIKGIEEKYENIEIVDIYKKDGKLVVEPKNIRPSSFPPEFPEACLEEIKSLKK